MKILFITKLYPYPLDAGGKLRTYRVLQLLSKDNEIHFCSFSEDNVNKTSLTLKKICKSIKIINIAITNQNHLLLLTFKLLCSIFSKKPFIVYKYYSEEMQLNIEKVLLNNKFDILFIDHISMAQYIPKDFKGRIICDVHDISYLAFERYAQLERNILLKIIFRFESLKLFRYESFWLKQITHILTISTLDKKRIIDIGVSPLKITFLPTPFSIQNNYRQSPKQNIILFIGLLSWLPNLNGIQWFIEKIYPLIKKKVPNIKLIIVGKDGMKFKRYLNYHIQDSSIRYLGYISELKYIYRKSSLFIVPILMGGGIRIKLLEALANCIPVISTSIGAEGIEVRDSENILLANTPINFANSVDYILRNHKYAKKISENGKNLVKSNYSFEKSLITMKTVLRVLA